MVTAVIMLTAGCNNLTPDDKKNPDMTLCISVYD